MKAKLLAAAMVLVGATQAQAADLLLHGGPIYTGEAKVEALAIKDGKVIYAGPLAQARQVAPKATDIDLKGAAAFPGLVDAHAHLMGIGLRELTLNLEGTASIAELAQKVKAWNAAHPGADPLSGRGWIETHYPEKRFPTRADLDAAVPDRAVVLTRADGHALVANSKMLALAGITRDTPDPAGGQILKDAQGEPTGMLIDNAQRLLTGKIPPPSAEMKREAAKRAVQLYASRGWTGMHSVSVNAEDVTILNEMAAKGELPIRVDNFMDPKSADEVLAKGPFADPTGLVRVDGIKMYMDGALGSRGAALLAPYNDAEGTGLILTDPAVISATLAKARAVKAQVAIHAIGDRGNRLVLDLFHKAYVDDPAALAAARWRVEHAQIIAEEDKPRFAKLGIIASMQPSHAIGDLYFAPARLGESRLKEAYAWKDLWDLGVHMAAGTDAPVEKGDPLIEFYAATYRHALNGFAGPDWGLDEVLTRPQALTMLTKGSAYAAFREKDLGDLSPGKAADISVFSADLMTVPFADIPKAHAVLTIVGGKIVYDGRGK